MKMTLGTQRTIQAAILAALGLFILQKIWSGQLFWYINERFHLLTLCAALGLLALALFIFFQRRGAGAHSHTEENGQPHEHAHDQSPLPTWALVAVAFPAIVALLIPARPLGASVLANKGVNTIAPLTAGGANSPKPVKLNIASTDRTIIDWVRAFNYESDPTVYTGQLADVVGFVYHDSRLGVGQFLVGRFTLTCCVADATAIGMAVAWPNEASLADNTWVRVRGPVKATTIDGQPLPLIQATVVDLVPEPAQPYLYP